MSSITSQQSSREGKEVMVEATGVYFTTPSIVSRQSRNLRAQFKRRKLQQRLQQQREPGCDAGGRIGGSIGPRREEPAGWQQRQGCKCALHYGGECLDYVKNPGDRPRRRSKNRPLIPVKYLRCFRCSKIGHLSRDCYESRYESTRKRSRVETGADGEKLYVTHSTDRVANQEDSELALVASVDEEENWDEEQNDELQISLEGESQLQIDEMEVRSVAEMTEDSVEIDFPSTTDEEVDKVSIPHELQRKVVNQIRMPSPEAILLHIQRGEQSLREALQIRWAEKQMITTGQIRQVGGDSLATVESQNTEISPQQEVAKQAESRQKASEPRITRSQAIRDRLRSSEKSHQPPKFGKGWLDFMVSRKQQGEHSRENK